MAGFWPLYSDFKSKAQVTLAMPGVPSKILKSIGIDAKTFLMIPNVEFLIAFMEGDVGIASAIFKKTMEKQLNSSIAASNEMVVRQFSKVNGLGLEDKIGNFKDASGKIKIPGSEISPSDENDSLGLKALEKTILQSIFESQKPYIEIAKIVISVLADIDHTNGISFSSSLLFSSTMKPSFCLFDPLINSSLVLPSVILAHHPFI